MNIFIAIVAALVIGLGGYFWYSGQKEEQTVPPPAAEPAPQPAPAPEPGVSVDVNIGTQVGTANVGIVNYQYYPKTLTVKKGTTVTWTNEDAAAHTVTSIGANLILNSALFGENKTYSYTFNEVGTFDYYCKPHPYMKGTVVVTN